MVQPPASATQDNLEATNTSVEVFIKPTIRTLDSFITNFGGEDRLLPTLITMVALAVLAAVAAMVVEAKVTTNQLLRVLLAAAALVAVAAGLTLAMAVLAEMAEAAEMEPVLEILVRQEIPAETATTQTAPAVPAVRQALAEVQPANTSVT